MKGRPSILKNDGPSKSFSLPSKNFGFVPCYLISFLKEALCVFIAKVLMSKLFTK